MRTVVISALRLRVAGCTAPPPPSSNGPIAGNRRTGRRRTATLRHDPAKRQGLQIANRNTLTFRSRARRSGSTQLQGSCGGFGQWDVLVTEPMGTQYCTGDLVRSFDPVSKIPGPACRLDDFVPYTKPSGDCGVLAPLLGERA